MCNIDLQASSGSLLLDAVLDHSTLPLQQLCKLSCVSASTRKVLGRSLQQHRATYPVTFEPKNEEQAANFTAW